MLGWSEQSQSESDLFSKSPCLDTPIKRLSMLRLGFDPRGSSCPGFLYHIGLPEALKYEESIYNVTKHK